MAEPTPRRSPPRRPPIVSGVVAGLSVDRYDAVVPAVEPDLVVVHGAMDRAAGFRRTLRHLPHRRAVAYDRRGYGSSVALDPTPDLAAGADDLVAVLSSLHAEDGRRRLVVGHSMGGLVALTALARPTIGSLAVGAVVWEAPLAWERWYRSRGDALGELAPDDAAEVFLRGVLGERLWRQVPASMRADRRAEGRALQADLRSAREPAARIDTAAIRLPVLVGWGTASSDHHRRSAVELAAQLGQGPAIAVDGADHGIHLSDPAAFADLIERWDHTADAAR